MAIARSATIAAAIAAYAAIDVMPKLAASPSMPIMNSGEGERKVRPGFRSSRT